MARRSSRGGLADPPDTTLDAINFGSGYFPHLRKRPGMSGYFTVATSLTDYYRERGPLSAQELTQLTAEDCARMFSQEPAEEPVRELMGHFARALNDLGRYLIERFDGSFGGLIEETSSSAERLARLLVERYPTSTTCTTTRGGRCRSTSGRSLRRRTSG
jgi:hypothetical protein